MSNHIVIIFVLIMLLIMFVWISLYLFKGNVNGQMLHCTSCDVKVNDENKMEQHGQCKLVYVCDNDKEHFTVKSNPPVTRNTSTSAIKQHAYNSTKTNIH